MASIIWYELEIEIVIGLTCDCVHMGIIQQIPSFCLE